MIALQETHLMDDQLFSFRLSAPKYTWFFSTGSSNLTGVAVRVLHSTDIQAKLVGQIAGHLLVLDVQAHGDFF